MSDLVGNSEDRFSHKAHMLKISDDSLTEDDAVYHTCTNTTTTVMILIFLTDRSGQTVQTADPDQTAPRGAV